MLKWININLNKTTTPEIAKQNDLRPISCFQTENLPGKILDLQFQCESQEATRELIATLTTLYTQAVEYYESNSDPRYRIYQKRLEHFLKKQNIDDILRGKSGQLVSKKDTAEKKITHARTKSKSQVNKLIDRSQKITNFNHEVISSNLKQQQTHLNQRIQRRKAMSNRSSNTRDDEDNEEGKVENKKLSRNIILDGLTERKWQKSKRVFM